jgi:hypothetical protein
MYWSDLFCTNSVVDECCWNSTNVCWIVMSADMKCYDIVCRQVLDEAACVPPA